MKFGLYTLVAVLSISAANAAEWQRNPLKYALGKAGELDDTCTKGGKTDDTTPLKYMNYYDCQARISVGGALVSQKHRCISGFEDWGAVEEAFQAYLKLRPDLKEASALDVIEDALVIRECHSKPKR